MSPEEVGGQIGHAMRVGTEIRHEQWLRWLADIDYGVNFVCHPPPPCSIRELAAVYSERDGEPVEEWVPVLLDGNSSGGWYGDGRDAE
jgi:hypothetical protein